MNKLILIGNGFDLAHGLKTKYSDFILWYLNKYFQKTINDNSYEDGLIKTDKQFGGTLYLLLILKTFKICFEKMR